MTPDEKEAFYDKEVAPILLELGLKCARNGLSFLAAVEYDPFQKAWSLTKVFAYEHSTEIDTAYAVLNKNTVSGIKIKVE